MKIRQAVYETEHTQTFLINKAISLIPKFFHNNRILQPIVSEHLTDYECSNSHTFSNVMQIQIVMDLKHLQ